ncbi:MAG: cytochrome ubiquinol oxidase subunit I [Rhabdochlamydiaceae bacterium]
MSVLFPQVANQVGWITAEVGRQPWIVYGLLKTVDGVSKSIQAPQVVGSIIMFIIIYCLLFGLFIFLLDRKIKHGPVEGAENDDVIYQNLGTQEVQ